MKLTGDQIRRLCPQAKGWIVDGIVANAAAFADHMVTTPKRMQHCMAQLAHESAHFMTTREYASGKAYEGRKDLGNTHTGDGVRYRGRGLIQITGRANARAAGKALGQPYEAEPELMEKFPHALLVSLWFWEDKGLNAWADKDQIVPITRRINGGTNGLDDRRRYLARAKAIWPDDDAAVEVLRRGSEGPLVIDLQRTLTAAGFKVMADGEFGAHTEEAVRDFQARHRLAADGVVGAATWAALDAAGRR